MKRSIIKAIGILAVLTACNYADAKDVDYSFVGNTVIVDTGFRTYYVDVTEELAANNVAAILEKVCKKVPETCAKN